MGNSTSSQTAGIRRLLDKMLPTDADLRAFLLDELGREVYLRFDGIQDRTQLVTSVLVQHGEDLDGLLRALQRWNPTAFARHGAAIEMQSTPIPARPETGRYAPSSLRRQRNMVWIALGFSSLLAVTLLILLYVRQGDRLPQFIIIQPLQAEHLSEMTRGQNRLDAPDQFVEKVKNAGLKNVRYEVGSERDPETQELRRLILALMKQNGELLAAMKYRPAQVQEWQKENRPQGQFLAQLSNRIESTLKFDDAMPDKVQLTTKTIPDKNSPPSNLENPSEVGELGALEEAVRKADRAFRAGEYQKAITLALRAQKLAPKDHQAYQDAWQIVAAAACKVPLPGPSSEEARLFALLKEAHSHIDAPARKRMETQCRYAYKRDKDIFYYNGPIRF